MTPFAIVGTIYLILLAICFAVSAASLAVIATKMRPKRFNSSLGDMHLNITADTSEFEKSMKRATSMARRFSENAKDIPIITNWPSKNGDSVEHGEG